MLHHATKAFARPLEHFANLGRLVAVILNSALTTNQWCRMELLVAEHPTLDVRGFVTTFPAALGELRDASHPEGSLSDWWNGTLTAPVASSDTIRKHVRDLLRFGKFKPTGRSKPASEYLRQAIAADRLQPINLAVDTCNLVSYHSGLPISVIDLEKASNPFRIERAQPGSSYVFNASGQTIDVSDLLCLCDKSGPCANAVKDSQRTKTGPSTRRTLSVLWGTSAIPGHTEATDQWYRSLLVQLGCQTEPVELRPS